MAKLLADAASMKAWTQRALLLLSVTALLVVPAGASANPDPEVHPGSFKLRVALPERDGWRMELGAESHRQIYLTAYKGATTIQYRVPGRASSRLLKADFGSLGRVDVKMDLEPRPPLRPARRERGRAEERCRGRDSLRLTGRFHGTINFDGERKVVGIFTRDGSAVVDRRFRKVCKPKPKPAMPGAKRGKSRGIEIDAHLFVARAHGGGRTTSLEVVAVGFDSEVLFGAISGGVHERLGRVRIIRSAEEFVTHPEVVFGKAETARLRPPKPFTGRASYLKEPGDPASWSGNLAVHLPGAGKVALAGPEFDAKLCHGTDLGKLAALLRCFAQAQALSLPGGAAAQLRDLYGSGSHSQPLALARLSSLR